MTEGDYSMGVRGKWLIVCLGVSLCSAAQAAANLHVWENNDTTGCARLLQAIRISPLAEMTNHQLCVIRGLPVSSLLTGGFVRDLQWHREGTPLDTEFARTIFEARIFPGELSKYSESEAMYLRELAGDMVHEKPLAKHAYAMVDRLPIFAVEMSFDGCSESTEFSSFPLFGLFTDSSRLHAVPIVPFGGGRLVYFGRDLAILEIGQKWMRDAHRGKEFLTVTVQIIDRDLQHGNDRVLGLHDACSVSIEK
ncbi:hypothetical protein [Dyella sp. EPa41]|uniref:hypothetical protein n=1 Tax=Dyella sp. EPa41 TaxID=1561194 RepID=UPI0019164527|nr:hypothetical protein [Dyella sp. EPa41]